MHRVEEPGKCGVQIYSAGKRVQHSFQFAIGLLLDLGIRPIAFCAYQSLLHELIELLHDTVDLDAQTQHQTADPLYGRWRKDCLFAHVAGGVRIGNIIAYDLQADLHRSQGATTNLNRAEKTHAPPEKRKEVE
jgi:hypothetical protein